MSKFFSGSKVEKFKEEKRGEVAELILNSLRNKAQSVMNRQENQFYMDDFLFYSFANIVYNQALTNEIMVSEEFKTFAGNYSNNGSYQPPIGLQGTTFVVENTTRYLTESLEATLSEVNSKLSTNIRSTTRPDYINNVRSLLNNIIYCHNPISIDNRAQEEHDLSNFRRRTRQGIKSQKMMDDIEANSKMNNDFKQGLQNFANAEMLRKETDLENTTYNMSTNQFEFNNNIRNAEVATKDTANDLVKAVVKHNIREHLQDKNSTSTSFQLPEVPKHEVIINNSNKGNQGGRK